MDFKKLISRKIERKISYTNGWAIDNEKYTKLCDEVAEDIIKTIKNKYALLGEQDG